MRGLAHGSTARDGERPRVAGRLVNSSGEPVQGARVCVAATTQVPGARERVLAKPTTDSAGRFSVRVRPAPAMRLRIAYWPGAQGALESFDSLRFRAQPTLAVKPEGTLHTGDRARFDVGLPASVRGGPTGPRSRPAPAGAGFRCSAAAQGRAGSSAARYRFHATTGRRVYRFRAVVPRQGLPLRAPAHRQPCNGSTIRAIAPTAAASRRFLLIAVVDAGHCAANSALARGCRPAARRSRRRGRGRGRSRAGGRRGPCAPRRSSSGRGGSCRPAPGCRTG